MVIVYESKTGFTKKYADMLSAKTGIKVYRVKELANVNRDEEIIFLGWMKVGRIQGFDKMQKYNVKAVCGSGTGRTAEPDIETVIGRNKIEKIPFFYLRGGCFPLKELRGMDKIKLTIFIQILKRRKNKDERTKDSILLIENGFDGVNEKNLEPVLEWLKTRRPKSKS